MVCSWASNRCELRRLISTPHFHLNEGVRVRIRMDNDSFYYTDQSWLLIRGVITVKIWRAIWESETSIHDQMNEIARRFFYTRDVAKFKRSLVDQKDAN